MGRSTGWVGWLLLALIGCGPIGLPGGRADAGGPPSRSGALATNPVSVENALPGDSDWQAGREPQLHELELYTDLESAKAGDSMGVHASVSRATQGTAQVFRLGYYGGAGARRVWGGGPYRLAPGGACPRDPVTSRVECDWPLTFGFTVGSDWVSGVYIVKVSLADGKRAFYPFVVRDGRPADLVFQPAFNTYQAYNGWGGESLYRDDSGRMPAGKAFEVSYNRPYLDNAGSGTLFSYELPMLQLLEKEGYDITYVSNLDFSRNPDLLSGSTVFVNAGHDEYWTAQQRQSLDTATAAGISVTYFGADGGYWRVRAEPDRHGRPLRTLVCYKSNLDRDPQPGTTVRFRDPPNAHPEDALFGAMYVGYLSLAFPLVVRDPNHWIFAGAPVAAGEALPGLQGFEYDSVWDDDSTPSDLSVIFESPLVSATGVPGVGHVVEHPLEGKGLVFNAGSFLWPWGVAEGTPLYDARVVRMTLNVVERALSSKRPPRALPDAVAPVRSTVINGAWARDVQTWAGTPGESGTVDGPANAARFWGPTGLALAPGGQVVVADTLGNRIRWVEADGAKTVVTLAGTGDLGARDGDGSQAMFRWPTAVAVSRTGDIYVADSNNYVIRRLTRSGAGWSVSTYAGGFRESGNVDGPGARARFNFLLGVAVDKSGVVYVADTGNRSVRRISPDAAHTVTTLPAPPGDPLGQPSAVTVNDHGDVFVLDAQQMRLCRLGTNSAWLVGAPDQEVPYADGPGSSARLHGQLGLAAVGDGTLVLADVAHRLRRVVPGATADSTRVLTLAGDGTVGMQNGGGAQAQISAPSGVAPLPDGRLVVSDAYHHVLRIVTP